MPLSRAIPCKTEPSFTFLTIHSRCENHVTKKALEENFLQRFSLDRVQHGHPDG